MKRFLKWLGIVLGGLVVLVVLAVATVFFVSNQRINRTYAIDVRAVSLPTDAEAVERGEHIAMVRGCSGCHAANFAGEPVIDEPPLGFFYASNITPGEGSVVDGYSALDWVRAIRHGVGPDGKALIFMPSHEYFHLGDQDMGDLIVYMQSLEPVDKPSRESSVGPVGRVLMLNGTMAVLPATMIDHDAIPQAAPEPAATAAYGRYLSTTCSGCHGSDFAGGIRPDTPPGWPTPSNLTPNSETGMGDWTLEDFRRVLREAVGPDGEEVSPIMPRSFAEFNDQEIEAMWLYFQSLEPLPLGGE